MRGFAPTNESRIRSRMLPDAALFKRNTPALCTAPRAAPRAAYPSYSKRSAPNVKNTAAIASSTPTGSSTSPSVPPNQMSAP